MIQGRVDRKEGGMGRRADKGQDWGSGRRGGWTVVVFRSDEKIGYGIVWELQNDARSLDAHDRLLLTPIKILIHPKYC